MSVRRAYYVFENGWYSIEKVATGRQIEFPREIAIRGRAFRDSHATGTVSSTYRGRQRKTLCEIFMRPSPGEGKKMARSYRVGVICKKDEVGRVALAVVKTTLVSR